jgi:hypothetical protein
MAVPAAVAVDFVWGHRIDQLVQVLAVGVPVLFLVMAAIDALTDA